MQAVIARAEATRNKVNAFTFTHFDEALGQAKKAEAKYARGARTGALEGLPVAIKDESYIKGKPTSGGSLIIKDFIAAVSSTMNERIMKAGGIVHARTATPEFSCAAYTWSRLWGVTRNPWNPDFTPGGSSGGSAASLASGTSAIATGSDIGGSIRIPASCCGVVGYKPPYGRNPDDPPFNLDFYCHTGPLARTVEDAILLQNVMTGPSPLDIASLRPKLTLPTEFKPIKGWKIAYSIDLGGFEVDPEVRKNTLAALDVFRSLGADGRGGRSRLGTRGAAGRPGLSRASVRRVPVEAAAGAWPPDDDLCQEIRRRGRAVQGDRFRLEPRGGGQDVYDARAAARKIRRADLPDQRAAGGGSRSRPVEGRGQDQRQAWCIRRWAG